MKTKVVRLSELAEDNPKLCMSTLRIFGECHKCDCFKKAMRGLPNPEAVREAIENMGCKPKVSQRVIELYEEKVKRLVELRKIEEEINNL
ncbi:MAG: hypothetical protein ACXQS2_04345 [Methermicoccaceae archaeon]